MGDFTKRTSDWLREKRSEIILQAAVIPLVAVVLSWIAKQFTEPGMVRDIGVIAICLAAVVSGCFLIVWLNSRKPSHVQYLFLLRVIAEGEKFLGAYDSIPDSVDAAKNRRRCDRGVAVVAAGYLEDA
jgi:hypothetical protein